MPRRSTISYIKRQLTKGINTKYLQNISKKLRNNGQKHGKIEKFMNR